MGRVRNLIGGNGITKWRELRVSGTLQLVMNPAIHRTSRRAALWGAVVLALAAAGCGTPEAKAPSPKRPIDEGRAVKLIAAAVRDAGFEPEPGRTITMTSGKKIQLDVTVKDHRFGFAYLTASDLKELKGDPIADKDGSGDDLIVRTGDGDDADVHFVVLYAKDYVFDDNVGEAHEATTITAENKLDRDTRDFIMIVKKQGWK